MSEDLQRPPRTVYGVSAFKQQSNSTKRITLLLAALCKDFLQESHVSPLYFHLTSDKTFHVLLYNCNVGFDFINLFSDYEYIADP